MLTSEKDDADLKLVDFGLATRVQGCNQNMYCGTLYYMVRKH
jgi:serine/threonine protein kinase